MIIVTKQDKSNLLQLPLLEMHLDVEIQYKKQNGSVQNRVEHPGPNPITPTLVKMQQQHPNVAHQVAPQHHNLAIDNERKASTPQSDPNPEPVPVDDAVEESGAKYRHDLKRLGEFEPEEGHADEDGLVEESEEGEVPAAEDGEECAEEVEEAGEVEEVGPEEDAAGGAGAEWEAEEPLEWGGAAPPEPSSVADFGGGGEEEAEEDEGREEGHG
ncbi:hypothetical protein Syun_004974 [Stephania yunnanensis]|uniref:Uncharacterized protein n=1 Tax=Stephania yunnanensis TaxID=152371 RepID=A0AAP0L5F9_9MAGN